MAAAHPESKGDCAVSAWKTCKALAASLKVLYLDRSLSEQQLYELNLRIASSYVQSKAKKEAKAIYRKNVKELY